jgi:hypothetical protein
MTVKMTKRQNPDVLIRVDAPMYLDIKKHQQINTSANQRISTLAHRNIFYL